MRKTVSSAGKFLGMNTVCADDGDPYLTRIWFWRLRLHIFHRGDLDGDCHDHPWDFWTFPLTSYLEEVVETQKREHFDRLSGSKLGVLAAYERTQQVVRAFRPHFRPAEHMHRVIGPVQELPHYGGFLVDDLIVQDGRMFKPCPGKIVTMVWFSKPRRKWGFLKTVTTSGAGCRGKNTCSAVARKDRANDTGKATRTAF